MPPTKRLPQRTVHRFNAWIERRRASPRWGRLLSRFLTTVTYTGRRSGRTFTIPVGYRRVGDDVIIKVELPDRKTWWRNFLGTGAPLAVELDGVSRNAHATSRRDDRGRVTVTARIEPLIE